MSQEELAERAAISVEAVSAYERGLRSSPRKETLAALVRALNLTDAERDRFESSARSRRGSPSALPALPWTPTTFVGRSHELEALRKLLAPRRLVTLVGPGGVGKTRIALQAVSAQASHAAVFVDLAPIADGTLLASRVAAAFGITFSESSIESLAQTLGDREALLLLDSCEHVISDVRSLMIALLAECPNLTILATSRGPLRVAGEKVYRLSPFAVPSDGFDSEEAARCDVVTLFADRADSAGSPIALTPGAVEAICEICRRVDGIPLAIELAVARLQGLGLAGLRSQLARDFRILNDGDASLPVRQRTLAATIAWSYNLLPKGEQTLFRRLAIFSGGWTAEAARSVCSDERLRREEILDALLQLVERSLVLANFESETPRYAFFDATREFAADLLQENGEISEAAAKHANWIASLVDDAYGRLSVTPWPRWAAALAPELDNAVAAVEWGLAPCGDAVVAGRVLGGLQGFSQMGALVLRGREYVQRALARISDSEYPAIVARLLMALYKTRGGDASLLERAIDLLGPDGDRASLARCYVLLTHAYTVSDPARAEACAETSISLLRAAGLQKSLAYAGVLNQRAQVLVLHERLDEAELLLREAIGVAQELDDTWNASQALCTLGGIHALRRDFVFAAVSLDEAIDLTRKAGNTNLTFALNGAAVVRLMLEETDRAEDRILEALTLSSTTMPDPYALHSALFVVAGVWAERGDLRRATRIYGYTNAWWVRTKWDVGQLIRMAIDRMETILNAQLDPEEAEALRASGEQLDEKRAIALARGA